MDSGPQRMMDGNKTPDMAEIEEFVGGPGGEAWTRLTRFMTDSYDIDPEMIFDRKGGWDVRYRKGGRTLITLTPEKGAVRVLLVLGKEEAGKALSMRGLLSDGMIETIEGTRQLHDGRWLWIRLHHPDEVRDIEQLVRIKRRPKG